MILILYAWTTIVKSIKVVISDDVRVGNWYDVIFIINPISMHYKALHKYHDKSLVEMPEKVEYMAGKKSKKFGIMKNSIKICLLEWSMSYNM